MMGSSGAQRLAIAVVGAGAMGCLFGARLALAGNRVILIDIDEQQISAIREHGLLLETEDGNHRLELPIGPAEAFEETVDLLLLFTKAQHSMAALASTHHLLAADSWVLTLQNGLGGGERVRRALRQGHVAVGMTNWPADLLAPGRVSTHGAGAVSFWSMDGLAHPMLERIDETLRQAGLASSANPDVAITIWEKVIFNAGLNPVAALTRLAVGGIASSEDGLALVDNVLAEAFAIAAAAKVPIDADRVRAAVTHALAHHGPHQPSMLKDLIAGRMTEIDVINGSLVDQAREVGVPASVNETLLRLVRLAQQPKA